MVGRGGFEPPYSMRTDLQSAAFNHSATYPYKTELELLIEESVVECLTATFHANSNKPIHIKKYVVGTRGGT